MKSRFSLISSQLLSNSQSLALDCEFVFCEKMQTWLTETKLPDEAVCAVNMEHESLFALNRLCQVCADFGENDFEKFGQLCMENDGVVTTEFGRLRRLKPSFSEQEQGQRMM